MDRALWMLLQNDPELLTDLVADPQWVLDNIQKLLIVWFDHSRIWVKFRGEEKLLVTVGEVQHHQTRKALSQKVRGAATPTRMQEEMRQALIEHVQALAEATFQIAGKVCPSGDKYRITIIDFPAIQNWLSQTEDPKGFFLEAILIVPCTQH